MSLIVSCYIFIEAMPQNIFSKVVKVKYFTDLNPDPEMAELYPLMDELFLHSGISGEVREEIVHKLTSGINILVDLSKKEVFRLDESTIQTSKKVIRDPNIHNKKSDWKEVSDNLQKVFQDKFGMP